MSKYRLKSQEVEAVQHLGPQSLNVVTPDGEKKAAPGDFIIIPESKVPSERKVLTAKEFFEKYELVKQDGESEESEGLTDDAGDSDKAFPGQPGSPTSVYGVPAFPSVEAAQSAAQQHYAPSEIDGEDRPAHITPFQCTIGSDGKVYAIQPSGIISQVPVAHADSTADPGFGTGSGHQDSLYPQSLAIQGGAVHDNPGPVSAFQTGSASVDQPLTTFGNTFQPDQANATNEAAKSQQPDEAEKERQKQEGVTQPGELGEQNTQLVDFEPKPDTQKVDGETEDQPAHPDFEHGHAIGTEDESLHTEGDSE